MWLPLALLLTLAYVQGQLTECPTSGGWHEWAPVGGEPACYRCFTNEEEWDKANNICKTYGGALASVHSRQENDQILDVCPGVYDLWIGLNDRDWEGDWVWSDRSEVVYLNWDSGEPDGNSRGLFNNDVHCAAQRNEGILPGGKGWEDEDCFEKKKFTCKVMLNQS
ncbi:C-type lectin APL-like [Ptychodera flava]|uniref:C-type lectin APL-like n=1 Tax=Ptychodera flava TaxID=63121 RepID=UPI00396AA0AC